MKKTKKIAALLTPLVLAQAPITLDAAETTVTYNHSSQISQTSAGHRGNIYPTTTFGGTQTFDYNGKPWDNDNDSDEG